MGTISAKFTGGRWDDYLEESLAILVNVSLNDSSHPPILSAEFPYLFDKQVKTFAEKHHSLILRLFNFFSKMSRNSQFLLQLLQANNVIAQLFASVDPASDLTDDCIRYSLLR